MNKLLLWFALFLSNGLLFAESAILREVGPEIRQEIREEVQYDLKHLQEMEVGQEVSVDVDVYSPQKGIHGYRDFFSPMYHGARLSYCSADKAVCGKDMANEYCKIMGYDSASRYKIEHNVGLTRFPNTDNLQCTGWQCDGFKWITCKESLKKQPTPYYYYRYRAFEAPRLENYRVAWCYAEGQPCGSRAADAFCRHQGYRKAKQYTKAIKVAATRTIGDGALCFGNTCQGFKKITCYR